MLLSFFKVKGHSMEPILKDGSFLIASSIPFLLVHPKTGDIILFESQNKKIIKRLVKIEDGKYYVEGENKKDNKKFPAINRKKVLGKVIIRL